MAWKKLCGGDGSFHGLTHQQGRHPDLVCPHVRTEKGERVYFWDITGGDSDITGDGRKTASPSRDSLAQFYCPAQRVGTAE